jgi:hypothetical protein
MPKYTIVRHSAWSVAHDPDFRRGIEEVPLVSLREEKTVRKEGGVVFGNYTLASDFAMEEMYPPEVVGLIPNVPGTFSKKAIAGSTIYIPGRKISTALEA